VNPIQERFQRVWTESIDTALTVNGAAAAALALDEGLGDERAAQAASNHVRAIQPVKLHLRAELKRWLRDGGPGRSVAEAKRNSEDNQE
jgi:hypothetical protein